MADTNDNDSLQQTSFRLSKETFSTLHWITEAKRITQSAAIRSAIKLLGKCISGNPNHKLAFVDVEDSRDATHFRVVHWILEPNPEEENNSSV